MIKLSGNSKFHQDGSAKQLLLGFAVLVVLIGAACNPLQAGLNPESGAFLFQKYTPKEYSASPQNWAIVQDSRGVMYFGNTDGVLEFDGVFWRRIPLTIRSGVLALAIDSRGTIFVGGQGIFGYLAADAQGVSRFVSLLDKVAPTDRSFSAVTDVLPTSDGVYFASKRRVFLYTPGGMLKVFRPTERFGRAFTYHEEFFVTSSDRGLLTMKGEDLVPTFDSDSKLLQGNPIFAGGDKPLLANSHQLYRFSPGTIGAFSTGAEKYFEEHGIQSLRQLPAGDILVGTKSGGLVMLNQNGEVERVLRVKDGLPSDRITAIYPDREGGLWIATDSGMGRLVHSITSFGELQGVHGNVYAIGRLQGVLYAGTSLGLFRMRTAAGEEPVFDPVPEIQDSVYDIVERDGLSLVGAQHGVFLVSGKKARRILTTFEVYDISFSRRDPNTVYIAGGDGIQVLKRSGNDWTAIHKESGDGHEFRTVLEDDDGRVWGTTADAVWRFDFASATTRTEHFTASSGVPAGWINAYLFRQKVVFASEKEGLLKFSEELKRFGRDAELGDRFTDGHLGVLMMREDASRNVWLTGPSYHGVIQGGQWYPEPLLAAGVDELFFIYLDADGTAWASGTNGKLFRYQRPPPGKRNFGVLLRSAVVTNQELRIFGGDGAVSQKLRLPYRDNALRFEFAAPFYEDESSVEYQVRLEGSEANWSPWTTETRKDYTNLPERKYNFHVRARNPHGVVSSEESFRFFMLPPWYRTWWAYAFYVAVFLFAGWLILRWRLRALEARNKWLEHVVEERTAEVRSERDQNETLLLNILPKPVASELRATGSVRPTSFEDVTVCFSDFVGFTLSSEKLPAAELISSLNDYFTAFDEIIGRYGLEKLKTIGDAYMFASGLPNVSPSHAVDAVMAALEMVEAARRLARPEKGVNWSIRLGLYSGPVVAGVVGVRKFAFDIWGNTVNFAARMESAGSANRVNLSETTGSRVFEFIECEPRGRVRIKEGREMEMYFAVRPKGELMVGPMIDGIPEAFRIKYEKAFSKPPKSFPNLKGLHGG